jgi:ubiquinone/menaquinone biosynthesis C-methylase UbiE
MGGVTMSDPFSDIVNADREFLDLWSEMLDVRAAHPRQVEMRDRYFKDIDFGAGRVLEVGCGTGAIAEALAARTDTTEVIGIDPSPQFIEIARSRLTGAEFRLGDALALDFDDESFDVVVFHTVLCHLPQPDSAIVEAVRVLREGGMLAVFDGDNCSMSVSLRADDPLAPHIAEYTATNCHDPWFMRTCRGRLIATGLRPVSSLLHGFTDPDYFRPVAERAIDLAVKLGNLDTPAAHDLRDEIGRRCDSGEFYGHALYASIVAQKPSTA